jgi:hypothetical protein
MNNYTLFYIALGGNREVIRYLYKGQNYMYQERDTYRCRFKSVIDQEKYRNAVIRMFNTLYASYARNVGFKINSRNDLMYL